MSSSFSDRRFCDDRHRRNFSMSTEGRGYTVLAMQQCHYQFLRALNRCRRKKEAKKISRARRFRPSFFPSLVLACP